MWKQIRGYDSYEVSQGGDIRSLNYNNTNRTELLKHDGLYCVLRNRGNVRCIKISRLVAQAFLGLDITDESICVLHIDGDPKNNHLSNLVLGSAGEGLQMYLRNNSLITHKKRRTCVNYNNQTKTILELREQGMTLEKIKQEVGLSISYISMICNGQRRVYQEEYSTG